MTGVVFTLAVAALLLPGFQWPVLPVIFFMAVSTICAFELANALAAKGMKPIRSVTFIGSLCVLAPLLPLAFHGSPGWRLPALVAFDHAAVADWQTIMLQLLSEGFACAAFLMLVLAMTTILTTILIRGPESLTDAVATSAIVIYVAFPLSCAILLLYAVPDGFLWMLAAPVASWVTDVFAFFVGSLFGRNKLVPAISPKKTLEGAIGGVIGCMAVMALWFVLFVGKGWPVQVSLTENLVFGLVTGLVCGFTAQFGDWLASAVKRWCGIKDFGNVLPGHGGVLDRFDSVLFTVPVMVLASLLYYLLQPIAAFG